MKYVCWFVAVLLAVALSPQPNAQAQSTPQAAAAVFLPVVNVPPGAEQTLAQYQFAQQVLTLVNDARANSGCAPLTMNSQLVKDAQLQSEDMALNNFFSHTNPDPSRATVGLRATAAGYDWAMVAENIAAGYSSPASVMSGWMSSSGHRANILNCAYTELGVGYYYEANDGFGYRHYWTQVFGRP